MTPEGFIKNQICEYLQLTGKFFWLNASVGIYDKKRKIFRKNKSKYAKNGTSDILGILSGGRFLAIEVKSKVGRLTPDQFNFISEVNSKGGLAFVARSVEDVKENLKNYL